MTLTQIEYFEEVCKRHSIAAAAEALYVSRSVISRSIGELEREFDTQLFTRSKNGVELTESGVILRQLFSEFMGSYGLIKERIHHLGEKESQRVVKVGITPTNGMNLYELYYQPFKQAHPDITVQVVEAPTHQAWDMLLEGQVDAFCTPCKIKNRTSFDSIDLYKTTIVLGISRDHPLARKGNMETRDILDLPLGYLKAPFPFEPEINLYFSAFDRTPNVAIRTSIHSLLQRLTEEGKIGAVLPKEMMRSWNNVQAVPLDFFRGSVHRVVWNKMIPHNEAFDEMMDFLRIRSREVMREE
jgi:DNA-binding transcriptional LysR family regulator